MKWVVVAGFLLCFANNIRAGVRGRDLPFGKECLPGSQWISQCNSCTCNADGRPACTDRICPGHENEPMRQCAPSTRWQIECFNTCSCGPEGTASCTELGCADENPYPNDREGIEKEISVPDVENEVYYSIDFEDFDDHQVVKRSVCEPNELFEVECNSCKCDNSGQSYSCTQSECLERDMDKEVEVFKESEGADHVERHSVCKPRDTFHVGCSTCHCNIDGTDFACATRPCPLLNDVEFLEVKAMKAIFP